MILQSLDIAGFGRFSGRRFVFDSGLNVVYGPNESGKSTLAGAIVATLYGSDRKKDLRRPWSGTAYGTTLRYALSSGEVFEVQRDFDRDAKGVRVYDRSGNDLSAGLAGKRLAPGEAHLGIPLDVFTSAACVKQQSITIERDKAAPIATYLARALDGGPRDDAALGAIARLDEALRRHVGTDRAIKNVPLRTLRARAAEQRAELDVSRARLSALDDVSEQLKEATHEQNRLSGAVAEVDRGLRSLRAGALQQRLENLQRFRAEYADLQADCATYDDVSAFPLDRESEFESAFHAWEGAEAAAGAAQAAAAAVALDANRSAELETFIAGAGRLDQTTLDALSASAQRAATARDAETAAAHTAAEARLENTASPAGRLVYAAATFALCVALGFAIAHEWSWTSVAAAIALVGIVIAVRQVRAHSHHMQAARARQQFADEAAQSARSAYRALDADLAPLGFRSIEELLANRTRGAGLLAQQRTADAAAHRARTERAAAEIAAVRLDRLAESLCPGPVHERAACRMLFRAHAVRKRERDGLAAHLHALELRKTAILGNDDEYALETELQRLLRDGVAAVQAAAGSQHALESERNRLGDALRAQDERATKLAWEHDNAQKHLVDLASLEEAHASTVREIVRLETFERALLLAKSTLEWHTVEAHQAFARRLERYAAPTLSAITGGRYGEIRVDPTTLRISLRVPETAQIRDLEAMSAGTRDQAYLVVRFAMARMFAEGFETPPLLLDDPFAYWDAVRVERCLPVIIRAADESQTILFTASAELAHAAAQSGAHRIDLNEPALV